MRKQWYWLLLVMLAVVLVACNGETKDGATEADSSDGETKAVTAEGGTIKIGVLASLTGALESYGKQTQRGFDLGIEYATGGTMEVNGKKIEIVYEDTETKPEVAVQKRQSF